MFACLLHFCLPPGDVCRPRESPWGLRDPVKHELDFCRDLVVTEREACCTVWLLLALSSLSDAWALIKYLRRDTAGSVDSRSSSCVAIIIVGPATIWEVGVEGFVPQGQGSPENYTQR